MQSNFLCILTSLLVSNKHKSLTQIYHHITKSIYSIAHQQNHIAFIVQPRGLSTALNVSNTPMVIFYTPSLTTNISILLQYDMNEEITKKNTKQQHHHYHFCSVLHNTCKYFLYDVSFFSVRNIQLYIVIMWLRGREWLTMAAQRFLNHQNQQHHYHSTSHRTIQYGSLNLIFFFGKK